MIFIFFRTCLYVHHNIEGRLIQWWKQILIWIKTIKTHLHEVWPDKYSKFKFFKFKIFKFKYFTFISNVVKYKYFVSFLSELRETWHLKSLIVMQIFRFFLIRITRNMAFKIVNSLYKYFGFFNQNYAKHGIWNR